MRNWILVFNILLLVSMIGCLQGDHEQHQEKVMNEMETIEINMMIRSYVEGGWHSNHPLVKELNQKLNIDLNIEWVPTSNFEKKLDVIATSNQYPDVFFITNSRFRKWRDSDLFLDVKPHLEEYPNLTRYIPERAYQLNNPDDKYLGFPVYIQETLDSLVIRKDWLDKLELEVPITVDEFYQVAKAFVYEDPNGTERDDTIGFTIEINPRGVFGFGDSAAFFMAGFGLVNGWQIDDEGALVPMQTQKEELKNFIGFLRKAYAEGVLDHEFPYIKDNDSIQKLQSSHSGISVVSHQYMFSNVIPPLLNESPQAEIVQVEPLIGPDGESGILATGGGHKIVVNDNITPKKQQKILELLDFMLSDEGNDLLKHGIEGIHYQKKSEDDYEVLQAGLEDKTFQLLSTFLRRFGPTYMDLKWLKPEEIATIESFNANNEKVKIENVAVGLESPTADRIGKDINRKWMETMVNIITGKEPLKAVEDAVTEWKVSGGNKIIEEINESYHRQSSED